MVVCKATGVSYDAEFDYRGALILEEESGLTMMEYLDKNNGSLSAMVRFTEAIFNQKTEVLQKKGIPPAVGVRLVNEYLEYMGFPSEIISDTSSDQKRKKA
ncbi:MAG: hypothetical protein RSD95_03865 [Clostridia bacterium]